MRSFRPADPMSATIALGEATLLLHNTVNYPKCKICHQLRSPLYHTVDQNDAERNDCKYPITKKKEQFKGH